MAKESTSRTNDYQDFIQPHESENLEFSDYGRECSRVVKIGTWAGILGICGATWGFVVAWLYPVIHKLLQ